MAFYYACILGFLLEQNGLMCYTNIALKGWKSCNISVKIVGCGHASNWIPPKQERGILLGSSQLLYNTDDYILMLS
jgi:hypothetical protein